MTVVAQTQGIVVVEQDRPVTVVQGSPLNVVVTEVGPTTTVVSPAVGVNVIAEPRTTLVAPVIKDVTVVAAAPKTGPKIFFSPTPPSGANLNDIWIQTAA